MTRAAQNELMEMLAKASADVNTQTANSKMLAYLEKKRRLQEANRMTAKLTKANLRATKPIEKKGRPPPVLAPSLLPLRLRSSVSGCCPFFCTERQLLVAQSKDAKGLIGFFDQVAKSEKQAVVADTPHHGKPTTNLTPTNSETAAAPKK
jgi:hypothetical protein